ncbi:MAG TPA: hypothetical protein VEI52_24620 [Terriglobales bacterium]|nr:hypothetical protein [Terriglobales bacterium]
MAWCEGAGFSDANGGFLDTGNYRKRVLHKLADELELPKLTFQVIRRTITTLAQKKGTVKDVQGLLRHSRTATTTDVYMQEIPERICYQMLPKCVEDSLQLIGRIGGPGRVRTDDLFHAISLNWSGIHLHDPQMGTSGK